MHRRLMIAAIMAGLASMGPVAQAEDLLDVYRLATEQDPQVRASAAGVEAARESITQARARFKPTVSLGADVTYQYSDSSRFDTSKGLNAGYNLSLTQALYDRDAMIERRQAEAEISQAEASYLATQQALILRVSDAYFGVLAAQNNLEFAKAERTALARQLEQAQQRFNVGLSAITDVHEARARHDQAVAAEIAAANAVDAARETLREITAQAVAGLTPLGPELPLVGPDPADVEQWVRTAVDENPQIAALGRAVDLARETIERQKAVDAPTVDLVGSQTFSDRTNTQPFGSRTTGVSVGVQVNWPFYQGGRVASVVREAQHNLTVAQENLEQQRRSTVRGTRSAYLNVQAAISRVDALKQAVVSSQAALDASQAGYEVGTRTIVDVLDSQRALYRAQSDYSRARYDYLLETLRLKQASGVVSLTDLERINALLR